MRALNGAYRRILEAAREEVDSRSSPNTPSGGRRLSRDEIDHFIATMGSQSWLDDLLKTDLYWDPLYSHRAPMMALDLRTLTRVTLVIGMGLIVAPWLILFQSGLETPVWFQRGLRLQVLVGSIVFGLGLAFRLRQPWARGAAILLLRAGAIAAGAWQVYVMIDILSSRGSSSIVLIFVSIVVGFVAIWVWLTIFRRGVAYLNQPELIAELENRAQ